MTVDMTNTELLTQALILDQLFEAGLIKQETIHDTLDQLVEQSRETEDQSADD